MSLFYHLINESEQKFYITSTPVQKKQYFFWKNIEQKGLSENYWTCTVAKKKTHSRSCWDVKRCFDFRVQTGMTHRLATHVLALTNFNGLLDAILFFSDLSQNFWHRYNPWNFRVFYRDVIQEMMYFDFLIYQNFKGGILIKFLISMLSNLTETLHSSAKSKISK